MLAAGALLGGASATAVEAPMANTPPHCLASNQTSGAPYRVVDVHPVSGQLIECYRKASWFWTASQTIEAPQRLDVGQEIVLHAENYTRWEIVRADPNDPNSPVITHIPIIPSGQSAAQRRLSAGWTFHWFNEFDDQPAMRNLTGELGNSLSGYNDAFLIPPTFDMSGCRDESRGSDAGRLVRDCRIKLLNGPVYKTGTTAPMPWTVIMGYAPRSQILNRAPGITNCAGTCGPQLFKFNEYNEAAMFLQPSPFPRMTWTINPNNLLETEFDARATLYNGTIDRYEWLFSNQAGDWTASQDGALVTQLFPGVGTYPVRLKVYAGSQVKELTGTVVLSYNSGGLGVQVDANPAILAADPSGANLQSRSRVRITVTNSGATPIDAVLEPDLFRMPGQGPADPTVLRFVNPPDLNFYVLGSIAPNGSVVREFDVFGALVGEGRVKATVNGVTATKTVSVTKPCRVIPPASGAITAMSFLLPSCPYVPPLDYRVKFSNGTQGSPVFRFERGPAGEILRQAATGLERFTSTGWGARTKPAPSQTLLIAPQTWITANSSAGADRVEIADQNSFGGNPTGVVLFQPGDRVTINPGGATEERRTISALGSLVFSQPFQFAHAVGEMVTLEPPADTTAPGASIASPGSGAVAANAPVTISGTATDNVGVTSVGLAIYRGVGGGQYWNGTSWQSAFVRVPTTLNAQNETSTNWSYSFVSPPGGSFAINATSFDAGSNYGFTSWVSFSVADTTAPVVVMSTPNPGQAFGSGPVTISGTATDNAGVFDVLIVVWRPVAGGQYWNGTAWQAGYVGVSATAADPGAVVTGYTYDFVPGSASGFYYTTAVVLDTNYNFAFNPWREFRIAETVLPTISLTTPAENASVASPLTITGSASDNAGVLTTAVAIYRTSTNQYWNGTAWQDAFATVPATTASPGAALSTFSATVAIAPPGSYLVAGFVYDTNYNYALSTFRSINVT